MSKVPYTRAGAHSGERRRTKTKAPRCSSSTLSKKTGPLSHLVRARPAKVTRPRFPEGGPFRGAVPLLFAEAAAGPPRELSHFGPHRTNPSPHRPTCPTSRIFVRDGGCDRAHDRSHRADRTTSLAGFRGRRSYPDRAPEPERRKPHRRRFFARSCPVRRPLGCPVPCGVACPLA